MIQEFDCSFKILPFIMEDICKRFPLIAESIVKNIDFQSMSKSKKANRELWRFFDNGKYFWQQLILKNIKGNIIVDIQTGSATQAFMYLQQILALFSKNKMPWVSYPFTNYLEFFMKLTFPFDPIMLGGKTNNYSKIALNTYLSCATTVYVYKPQVICIYLLLSKYNMNILVMLNQN